MPTSTSSNVTFASITTEKTRISERIAKLQTELAELEAAERVMTRYGGKMAPPPKAGSGASAGVANAPSRRRGRPAKTPTAETAPTTARAKRAKSTSTSGGIGLSEACCNVVAKYPGSDAARIMAALKTEYGLAPRPNHLGIALQRAKRGGRLQQRDGTWYPPEQAKAA